jgi:NitT/TauT family transport system ATP-binding protein
VSNTRHVSVEGLGMVYRQSNGGLTALSNLDLVIGRGEFVSIIGPSGCGKSTLLRIIGGLLTPTTGRVSVDGRSPREAQSAKQIGFVFQDASLLPWRKVSANVRLPLEVNPAPGQTGKRASGQDRTPDPEMLVELVGLGEFRDYYPHQLSGGMQQRVALARALVTEPALLLMDEPFGALDEITRATLRQELLRVWASEAALKPRTVVFVTHSVTEAVLLSDRVIVMTGRPGRIAADLRIDLPRPRGDDLELSQPFLDYVRELRGYLRDGRAVPA